MLGLVLATLPSARAQIDLVQGFADALGDFSYATVPGAAEMPDEGGDLFTLEGDAATAPPHVDILGAAQFGFSYDTEAFDALFGTDGVLACDAPSVACPTYDIQADPFAEGAFVFGFELAAAPDLAPAETLTLAVLAFDDEWPSATDPRPASPFPGTNKAWRVDISGSDAIVRFLQVTTGPYEEFQTDARVLLDGPTAWFVIPPAELPLTGTITGIRAHSFQDPAADIDGEQGSSTLTTPVEQTGELTTKPLAAPTEDASAVASATPAPSAEPGTSTGGGLPWLLIAAIVGAVLLALLAWLIFRPRSKCDEEYRAWKATEAECKRATAEADRAEAEAERLRAELDQLRTEYPPLGSDASDEPAIEMDDGTTMSQLDIELDRLDARRNPASTAPSPSRRGSQSRHESPSRRGSQSRQRSPRSPPRPSRRPHLLRRTEGARSCRASARRARRRSPTSRKRPSRCCATAGARRFGSRTT